MKDLKPISSLIHSALPELPDRPSGPSSQVKLRDVWKRILPEAALSSHPLMLESGRVIVYTESSAVAQSLRMQSRSLKDTLVENGLEVFELTFRVRPLSSTRNSSGRRRRKFKISEESAQSIERSLSAVRSSRVRESLCRLIETSRKKRNSAP
ncbi:MAG: DciA family protein [Pseudomonadota bacterium]